ncbi:methyltransferase family protein [Thermodesulfobacteriota bacterium]
MRLLNLAIMWIFWCVLHSGMISVTATTYFKQRLGSGFRFYRLIFNAVAVVSLVPVVLYGHSIRGAAVFHWNGPGVLLRAILLAAAVGLFFAGAKHYDFFQFLGVRQIKDNNMHGAITESGRLDTTGILNMTRHPWYLGAILLVWTYQGAMDVSALISNTILTVYLVVGTVLEERKLIMVYGEEYRRYQKNVSMLFPLKYIIAVLKL